MREQNYEKILSWAYVIDLCCGQEYDHAKEELFGLDDDIVRQEFWGLYSKLKEVKQIFLKNPNEENYRKVVFTYLYRSYLPSLSHYKRQLPLSPPLRELTSVGWGVDFFVPRDSRWKHLAPYSKEYMKL